MPKVRGPLTRQKSGEKYGGGPCELSTTDPSTYRQLIQHYYYVTCTNPNATFWSMVQQISMDLKSIWSSVNPRLPLITSKAINRKIKDLLCVVKDINRKHCKSSRKQNLDSSLDKLFDISACSCLLEIVPCSHSAVHCRTENCTQQHILCICSSNARVPVEDRLYLRDQRLKTGPKGAFQMSSVDKASKSGCKKDEVKACMDLDESQLSDHFCMHEDPITSNSSTDDSSEQWQPNKNPSGSYNLVKFHRFAMELVRGECSSTLGAALGNALLQDIKHLLRPEVDANNLMMDKCKLDRAKAKVKLISEDVVTQDKTNIVCIGIDGKVDLNTLTYVEVKISESETVLKKCVSKEHHLTFTCEDGRLGEYLTHRTIPTVGATADVLAQETLSVIQEYNCRETVHAILLDNTPVNVSLNSGLVVKLEKLLGKNLHIIGCALHQNELPLRSVFKKLDGEACGPTTFTGSIGKQCAEDIHNNPQITFEVVNSPLTYEFLSDEVLKDLSNDQRLLLEYCKGISSGRVDDKWAARKIGPLNLSRWLTLAIRILCLYTRTKKPTLSLKKLVYFIVCIYTPAWFQIKASSKLHDSPRILFTTISRLNVFPFDDVKMTAMKSIQRNAFCLLPQNFLYAMVKDNNDDIRNFGLQTILINRMKTKEETQKQLPQINWNSTCWSNLVDITERYFTEPPTTQHFSEEQIQSFITCNSKPDIPDFPSHSQSVERSVKLVSEVSGMVYGFENRHRSILTILLSRKHRPQFTSKGYYSQTYDYLSDY